MEYPVIVEPSNGHYRALIPALADLSAEGQSPDEATRNVQAAAEAYLSTVELRTIRLELPAQSTAPRYATARDWLAATNVFAGDEAALAEHFAEIETNRQRARESANQLDEP
jgi:predicted RNase H-like HicB family nuclease